MHEKKHTVGGVFYRAVNALLGNAADPHLLRNHVLSFRIHIHIPGDARVWLQRGPGFSLPGFIYR